MKNIRFLTFVLTIGTLLLSACGAAATPATPAPIATSENASVDAMPVAFVGIVDSIAGDQWVISGTTMTVDASIVRNGPFGVGDRIKVEGFVNPDGSLTVSQVETPTPQDILTATPFVVDNSNDVNVNDGNINDDNSNSLNSNDDNSNTANANDGNVNDDNGGNSNSSDDNSNTVNSNDDNGSNSNDDNSNASNSNDDNSGGNSNDDSGGSNSNDDNGGGGNSNDDNGNGG
jgi:uncharacterized membrane protein YgcG